MRIASLSLKVSVPIIADKKTEDFFNKLTKAVEKIESTVGTGGTAFFYRKARLNAAAPDEILIVRIMDKPSYIRPLLELWLTDESFLKLVQPSKVLLEHVEKLVQQIKKSRMGRMALRELVSLFFTYYTRINDISTLGIYISVQLSRYASFELLGGMKKLKEHSQHIFNAHGHQFLATRATEIGAPLINIVSDYEIAQSSNFFHACQNAFYLQRLEKLHTNEQAEEFLKEIQQTKVFNSAVDDKERLGHKVLRILISKLRSAKTEPSKLWLDTILAIGGDPRGPKTQKNYREWWAPLEEWCVQSMYAWLSEADILLFLQIWKDFVEQEGDSKMRRMYLEREYFLRGLIEQKGILKGSRLFVGRKGQSYINRKVAKEQRPYFSYLSDPDLVVVYLNLGTAHLVEGSHDFALSVMDNLPELSRVNDYNELNYTRRNLGIGLQEAYENEYGKKGKFLRKMHGGVWQKDVREALLRLGINISLSKIMK